MLNLPDKDKAKKMQVLHSLHVLSLDKKHAITLQWLQDELDRLSKDAMEMDGVLLYRVQGAQKVLAEILNYVRTSSELIDTWSDRYKATPG